ncbi:MAG: A/G-specific adenine glycosylase [Candidatus Methylacidiphilales bacterium]|nr:A/G-specific adenine glycosylase [Candidatus Methylacidiphilales bacterium]
MSETITPAIRRAFHGKLRDWYAGARRDLPWRRTQDPYAIVVSEYMLQQTQVSTVIPYYERWLQRFPDWATLAGAEESEVLKAWEGLGYYRRARFLHRLAREVSGPLLGRLPREATGLRELPGIGPYMAGAVASIAFGARAALVDGNVERVFARIFALADPTDHPATKKLMWQLAEALLPESGCGDHNQALMELGAVVCTPRNPRCLICPLQKICRADDPHRYPVKKKTPALRSERSFALVTRAGKVWLLRPESPGLWKGLHRLPEWDGSWMEEGEKCGSLNIAITTHRIRATVVRCRPRMKSRMPATGGWFATAQASHLTLPSPHRRMLALALKESAPPP